MSEPMKAMQSPRASLMPEADQGKVGAGTCAALTFRTECDG